MLLVLCVYSAVGSLCPTTTATNANRMCTFGTLQNFAVVRNTLFKAAGYPISRCEDQCSCIQNKHNQIARMLTLAESDPSLYSNNSLCENQILTAGRNFITAGFPADGVCAQAQIALFKLCGTQNGVSCMGKCNSRIQVDTPKRPCDSKHTTSHLVPAVLIVTVMGLYDIIPGSTSVIVETVKQNTLVKSKVSM
jgi:hypothetical protein